MNMEEYLAVKDFTYLEYCDYLQRKYGIGLANYMTKSFYPKPESKRTSEGLLVHHIKEDSAALLSTRKFAQNHPYEWQLRENLVYCDYLEHLLLHILICKFPAPDRVEEGVGGGGIVFYLVPELNDLYSGWETKEPWRRKCHERVINDKEVYLKLLKQFIENEKGHVPNLCTSFNDQYGLWDAKNNGGLYKEIKALCEDVPEARRELSLAEKREILQRLRGEV